MRNKSSDQVMSSILLVGASLITLLVVSGTVTDPVNVPKHVLLGGVGFALGSIYFVDQLKNRFASGIHLALIVIAFWLAGALAVLNSDSPLSQNLYGTYGRNTGFIAYISLTLMFLAASSLTKMESLKKVIYALLFSGVVNIAYCLWAWQIGDFIAWNNEYNRILGTFGNPNFIGAFLGMVVSLIVALILSNKTNYYLKGLGIVLLVIAAFEIQYSKAVQGVVVSAGGVALVVFFYLRGKFSGWTVPSIYALCVTLLGTVSVLGALQKGPLAEIVYKTSVSLRGEYWQAAWNMATAKPFTGVGMDAYGDWFRRARDDQALILPGPNVVTNAAHNVPFDVLAYGGWPLFIIYLLILAASATSIIKVVLRQRDYDFIFVGLSVTWICYQVQSVISINQIGIAIWGWILGGAVISYERITRPNKAKANSSASQSQFISPQLVGSIGFVIGLILAVPPYNADAQWRSALAAQDLERIKKALEPSYMTPTDSYRLNTAVITFSNSNMPDYARTYAIKGVEFNPINFDAWRLLYSLSNSSPEEKAMAKAKMIELDPLNPEWNKLP